MRYYVYVSATKVDLLGAQIPDKALSRIAATLTVDLKVVKAEFAGKDRQRTLYSQLELVERFLDEEGLIGTLDEPRPYVRARMPLLWGPLGREPDQFIYFGGQTEQTILGLGGSMAHVVGHAGGTDVPYPGTAFPWLLEGLRRELASQSPDTEFRLITPHREIAAETEDIAVRTVELMTLGMSGQPQMMEFVAKRLALQQDRTVWPPGRFNVGTPLRRDVLLGSPLYVTLVD